MADLVEFLIARLDEEQAGAEAARDAHVGLYATEGDAEWRVADGGEGVYTEAHGINVVVDGLGYLRDAVAAHIARHDPARVLAEVKAKRAILALHTYGGNARHPGTDSKIPVCAVCESPPLYYTPPWPPEVFLDDDGDPCMWPCLTLRHLAATYDQHPDYKQAWRVE
jgi:hypothetical protein